jgi:thiol-disulfide isomerase/thioredoxin
MKTLKSIALVIAIVSVFAFAVSAQTSLAKLDGGLVDVQAQKGKVVILAVGASWLPLSNKQAEYTNLLAKKYVGKNVVIYFVVTDSTSTKSKNFASDEAVRKFAMANKLTMPILRDSDGTSVLKKFKVDQIPSFLILDKDGNQSGEAFGGIDPKFDVTVSISKKIDSLL